MTATGPLTLDTGAYGVRTSLVQQVVSRAERIRFRVSERDARVLELLAVEHVAALQRSGLGPSRVDGVFIANDWSELPTLWRRAAPWRAMLGESGKALDARAVRPEYASLLKPPIWPRGAPNIIGVVLVATQERLSECPRRADHELAWRVLCFLEKIVDHELLATLIGAAELEVFSTVTAACLAGYIPFGFLDNRFWFLELPTPTDLTPDYGSPIPV